MKKSWLIVSVSSLVLLLFMLMRPNLGLNYLMKIIVDNFSIGISNAKIIGFLIYLFLFSLIISLNLKFKRKHDFKKIFLAILIIGYIINLFSYVYFVEKYDLKYDQRYETVIEGRLSSTRLLHIHTLKSVFTFFTQLSGSDINQNYDAGIFYYQYLPSFFWISGSFILITLLILAVMVLLSLKKDLKEDRNFFLILYIISSFTLIKNIFDGGFFSNETILWFSVLLAALFYNRNIKEALTKIIRYWLIVIPAYLVLTVLFKESSAAIITSLTILLFIIMMYVFYYYLKKGEYLKSLGTVFVYLLCALLLINIFPKYSPLSYDYDRLLELGYVIPEKSTVFLYSNDNQLNLPAEYRQKDFVIYKFETYSPISIYDFTKKYGIKYTSYLPIKVQGVNCEMNDNTFTQIKEIKVLESNGLKESINTKLFNSTMSYLGEDIYELEINYENNCFSAREVMPKILSENGLTTFIW